ncbi:MAG: transglycosylase family protein [Nanoarchaeota archaeon]|nr:transglycosylase family protein [Nanoarchaeota archaeon]
MAKRPPANSLSAANLAAAKARIAARKSSSSSSSSSSRSSSRSSSGSSSSSLDKSPVYVWKNGKSTVVCAHEKQNYLNKGYTTSKSSSGSSSSSSGSSSSSTTNTSKNYYRTEGTNEVYDQSGRHITAEEAANIPDFWSQVETKEPTTVATSDQLRAEKDDPFQSIKSVFGQEWEPTAAFTQELQAQGIYGAVQVQGYGNTIYTLGKGGGIETRESYKQKFGRDISDIGGIVGSVSPEQAVKLGVVVPSNKLLNLDLDDAFVDKEEKIEFDKVIDDEETKLNDDLMIDIEYEPKEPDTWQPEGEYHSKTEKPTIPSLGWQGLSDWTPPPATSGQDNYNTLIGEIVNNYTTGAAKREFTPTEFDDNRVDSIMNAYNSYLSDKLPGVNVSNLQMLTTEMTSEEKSMIASRIYKDAEREAGVQMWRNQMMGSYNGLINQIRDASQGLIQLGEQNAAALKGAYGAVNSAQNSYTNLERTYNGKINEVSGMKAPMELIGGHQNLIKAEKSVELGYASTRISVAKGNYSQAKDSLNQYTSAWKAAMEKQIDAAEVNVEMYSGLLSDAQKLAKEQAEVKLDIYKDDYKRILDTQDEVKELALLYPTSGIRINDTWERAYEKVAPHIHDEKELERRADILNIAIKEKQLVEPLFEEMEQVREMAMDYPEANISPNDSWSTAYQKLQPYGVAKKSMEYQKETYDLMNKQATLEEKISKPFYKERDEVMDLAFKYPKAKIAPDDSLAVAYYKSSPFMSAYEDLEYSKKTLDIKKKEEDIKKLVSEPFIKEMEEVRRLSEDYPNAGITSADSYDYAYAKARPYMAFDADEKRKMDMINYALKEQSLNKYVYKERDDVRDLALAYGEAGIHPNDDFLTAYQKVLPYITSEQDLARRLKEANLQKNEYNNQETQREVTQSIASAEVEDIMKAIRTVESGGNYQARGGSGEYGAYQFMPETWAGWSRQYASEVLKMSTQLDMTKENQDAVARWKIEKLVSQGYNPQQIASIWNSGSPDWKGKTGTNSYGVKYDVPNYVNKITNQLQGILGTTGEKLKVPQWEYELGVRPGMTAAERTKVLNKEPSKETVGKVAEWEYKLGVRPGMTTEEKNNVLTKGVSIHDKLKRYKDEGYSRDDVERSIKSSNKIDKLPERYTEVLDQLYGKKENFLEKASGFIGGVGEFLGGGIESGVKSFFPKKASAASTSTKQTPTKQKRTLISIVNERKDVYDAAKTQGGNPYARGTKANNWLNNWWNTSGKNEYPNVTLI